MKKRIEEYLPDAIKLVSEVGIADAAGVVKNEFNGYFSSFGAAIVQSGLKPALAFFSNVKKGKTEERAKIMIAIYKLVVNKVDQKELIEKIIDFNEDNQRKEKTLALLNHILNNKENEEQLKAEIIDASIALKLAVRTYKLEK